MDFGTIVAFVMIAGVGAIVIGIVIRLVRAEPGNRMRSAFGPMMAAADKAQSLHLGQPTYDEARAEAGVDESKDRYSSGP